MGSSSTWILSVKILLISAGVASVAMAMKFSVPLLLNFAVDGLPSLWSCLVSWLRPPYLYVVVNGIIITIAASSRFYNQKADHEIYPQPLLPGQPSLDAPLEGSDLPPVSIQSNFDVLEHSAAVYETEPKVLEHPAVVYESESSELEPKVVFEIKPLPSVIDVEPVPSELNVAEAVVNREDEEDEFVISRSTWIPPQRAVNFPAPEKIQSEFILPTREKPLVSSRFAHHRKPTKTSPEGARALRVAKPRKHETLESTWKNITDGRHMPLARHLRKSDTFENHPGRHSDVYPLDSAAAAAEAGGKKVVKKSETFRDRTNYENENHRPPPSQPSSAGSSPATSGGRLRKEGSLSHDELNRRVEAFIKKFNDEMRLQRQESLNQYMQMINRGAH